jgi:hypothetical protein
MLFEYMSKKRAGLGVRRAVKDFQMRPAHDLSFRVACYFLRSRIELDDHPLFVDKGKAYGQTPDDGGVNVGWRKNLRLTTAPGQGSFHQFTCILRVKLSPLRVVYKEKRRFFRIRLALTLPFSSICRSSLPSRDTGVFAAKH